MKFGLIAKHRGVWPLAWMCGALQVSRGGFYPWMTRPRSLHSQQEEVLEGKVSASFIASDRTEPPLDFRRLQLSSRLEL